MTNKILQIAFIVFAGAFSLGFLARAITEFTLTDDSKVISETMDEIRKVNPELAKNKNQLQVGDEIKMVYRRNENDSVQCREN